MALTNTFTLKDNFGRSVQFKNCHAKIVGILGNKDELTFRLEIREQKNSPVLTVQQYGFSPTLEGDNFIAQAYNHLKALPEFKNASDC